MIIPTTYTNVWKSFVFYLGNMKEQTGHTVYTRVIPKVMINVA